MRQSFPNSELKTHASRDPDDGSWSIIIRAVVGENTREMRERAANVGIEVHEFTRNGPYDYVFGVLTN